MRQFATQRAFFEPAQFALNADPNAAGLSHLLLLAIERALAPPVVHRRTLFQPMSIVVVDPALLSQINQGVPSPIEMPNVLPQAFLAPDAPQLPSTQFHQRAVRGEILSDEHGHLYEKLGRQIRPIHQLASGQFGEVIDLVPTTSAGPRMIAAAPGPKRVEAASAVKESDSVSAVRETGSSGHNSFEPVQKQQQAQTQESSVSHRKLFADPGQWRVVWWGEFKEILSPQLAHPERLKDTYRLPCYVQVLETERAVSIDELAKVYKSNNASNASNDRPARLYFLTDEIAAKLDLILPLRPAPASTIRREPNTLQAHERVFRLIAANDPTIDVTNVKSRLQAPSQKTDTDLEKAPAPAAVSLKESIPERFIKEFEFKISREEALYDLRVKPTVVARVRTFCRKLRVFHARNEILKWQSLLAGKNIDEQLWMVRPPAGMLTSLVVHDWATKTLAGGGYDAGKMIAEWEIFWRRKRV